MKIRNQLYVALRESESSDKLALKNFILVYFAAESSENSARVTEWAKFLQDFSPAQGR